MARPGASFDIGEDLGVDTKGGSTQPVQNLRRQPAAANPATDPPNVKLGWEQKKDSVPPIQIISQNKTEDGPSPQKEAKDHASQLRRGKLVFGLVGLMLIAWLASYSFSQTASFPGIDKAVETQILEGLRQEVSHRIAEDYRTVSEIRKRYMFSDRFRSLTSSPETKALIRSKQNQTKELFQDDQGMPYLYTPEAYRYAEIAGQELGLKPRFTQDQFSLEDLAMGKWIARFHRWTTWIGINQGLEWSTIYFPVAIGIAVVVLVSLTAWALSNEFEAVIFAGILASMHPLISAIFSAGLPHPFVLFLIPFFGIIACGALILESTAWNASPKARLAWISKAGATVTALALLLFLDKSPWNQTASQSTVSPSMFIVYLMICCAGAVLLSVGRKQNAKLKFACGAIAVAASLAGVLSVYPVVWKGLWVHAIILGRVLLGLCILAIAVETWNLFKKKHDPGLAFASAGFVLSLILEAHDPSFSIGTLFGIVLVAVFSARMLPGIESLLASFGFTKKQGLARWTSAALVGALLLAAVQASSPSSGLVLPGIDDSLAGAASAMRHDAFPNDVFIADPHTSDVVMYLSGLAPAVSNHSPEYVKTAFARAMMAKNDTDAKVWLDALSCLGVPGSLAQKNNLSPESAKSADRASAELARPRECPSFGSRAYLVLTDRTWESLIDLAKQAGIDAANQQALRISTCEPKPRGGIACQNGYELEGLNATRKRLFPERMVSFIGNKRIVDYTDAKLEGSFIIFREGEKLFSTIVPRALDDTFLVRAMGHDRIPFLQEVYSNSNPTRSVVYRLVEGDVKEKKGSTSPDSLDATTPNNATSSAPLNQGSFKEPRL